MGTGAQLRKAVLADAAAIARMHARNGLGGDVEALLQSCVTYPFIDQFGADFPLGWVLESDGEIVGSLGNIPALYEIGGRQVKAAIATAWAVDPEYRGKSIGLMMTFLRQPGIDLCLDGSASPTASQVLTGLKMARIPIPDYAVPCFWAVRPRAFVEAVLKRKSVPAAGLLAWPAGMLVGLRDVLRGSGRGRMSSAVRRLTAFDERWDGFWKQLSAGPKCLRAVRTSTVMKWRFGAGLKAENTTILVAELDGKMVGYAVLVNRQGDDLGMSLYDMADIQVLQNEANIMRDLIRGAVRTAREDGIDAVKLMSGNPTKRAPVLALRPYTYELPFWQLYFKTSNDLKDQLSSAEAWDFSLFETY